MKIKKINLTENPLDIPAAIAEEISPCRVASSSSPNAKNADHVKLARLAAQHGGRQAGAHSHGGGVKG